MSQPKLFKMCATLSEGRKLSAQRKNLISLRSRGKCLENISISTHFKSVRVTVRKPQKREWEVVVWQVVTPSAVALECEKTSLALGSAPSHTEEAQMVP